MLDPWAVKNSAWKKRLALLLYEREHLANAACIRALCEAEAKAIRAFGLKNPICIVPNGIDIPEVSSQKSVVSSQKANGNEFQVSGFSVSDFASGRKTLLFLGRIHPKKGLVNLIKAWAVSNRKSEEWVLAIAGWDQGGHESGLKRLATELGIAWADVRDSGAGSGERGVANLAPSSLLFLGPQYGEDKAACYRNCDAFILPSFSEGLPMVVLEAWTHGKPVLMTPECNLPEGFAAGAALRIEPSAESIAQGLLLLFQFSISDLQSTGSRGRALVAGKFAWPIIAVEMKSVYDWVLGGGPKPECVQTKS